MGFYVLISFLTGLELVSIWAAWKIWNHTTTALDQMWPGWPYGERLWFAGPRISALGSAFLLLFCAGAIPMQVGIDLNNADVLSLGFLVVCLSVVPFVLSCVVLLFNRPKCFVPPWLRDHRGLIG
jgi:hypothetical protein